MLSIFFFAAVRSLAYRHRMLKKLVNSGNSFALVVDKPLMRMLGIKPDTLLRVETDGRRIVIEPTKETAPPRASRKVEATTIEEHRSDVAVQLDARAVASHLIERLRMSKEQFLRLHHHRSCLSPASWMGFFYTGDYARPTKAERATMRRFEVCYRYLIGGVDLDTAIDAALQAVPMVRDY